MKQTQHVGGDKIFYILSQMLIWFFFVLVNQLVLILSTDIKPNFHFKNEVRTLSFVFLRCVCEWKTVRLKVCPKSCYISTFQSGCSLFLSKMCNGKGWQVNIWLVLNTMKRPRNFTAYSLLPVFRNGKEQISMETGLELKIKHCAHYLYFIW